MKKSNVLSFAAAVALALAAASCGSNTDFDAKSILEAAPVRLDGEQVTLSQKDVECGIKEELWDSPTQLSQATTVARLTPKGRALNFSDDVTMEVNSRPYVQVRGTFSLQVDQVTDVSAGEKDTKLVTASAGVKVPHSCFPNPLPIMGVKHGNFQHDTPASFQLHPTKDGWAFDRVVH